MELEIARPLQEAFVHLSPYWAGERYTVADIIAQCGLLLGKNTGTPIPAELKNLSRWFAEVTSRPTARA